MVKVADVLTVSLPSLTSTVMVWLPFRIFWNPAALAVCSKVRAVPLATPVRILVVLPSSFSVTVKVSPSVSLTVYFHAKAAFFRPRAAPSVLTVGAVLTLTVPSSETTSVEGRMKAGRTPQELLHQPLPSEPSVRTPQT